MMMSGRKRRREVLALALAFSLALIASEARATTEAEFNAALSEAASRVVTARTLKTLCDERDPAGESARRDALASWTQRNDIADYDAVMAALERRSDGLRKEIEDNLARARTQIGQALDDDATHCGDLTAFLADEKYTIKPVVRTLRRMARDFDLDMATPQPDAPEVTAKLVGLAHLSVLAEAEMAAVGSHEGARKDRDLRRAREARLEDHLERQGAVAGYGRVVSDDALREWRGAKQSRFSLSCRSFRDEAQEARMKNARGQNMVVVGQPRSVVDGENARINLRDCRLFTLEETRETIAETDDEAGLVHRPPEADEVYAGPGKGMAMKDIDRVLYVAEFENRLDGFGNGYTHREEDVYVLLRDGTAYRHAWSFPFTDLDVATSKEREPGRWMTWSKGWTGKVTLSQDGDEIDLSKAQELASLPADTRLDHSYYFLNVGMGGIRRDRSFVFNPDGTVTHARGGFVAGNFATSYMIVTSNRDNSVTSTYRFEDYALVLSHPEGEERRFFAVFGSAEKSDPDDVIIDGVVYWTRKAKEE
ncbi:hypothetical protein [Phytopseudomonas dryadis]|uniref:hypothetical protein n=1 Tax=Phytopseudomonas dryadis TaxID=2487520 RepID=UPI001F60EE4C|nr:hypothetical protein [Pseudomonas dryadis]